MCSTDSLPCCCVLQAEQALAAAAGVVQEQQEEISRLELSVRSAERARRLDAAQVHQMPSLEQWHSIQVGVDIRLAAPSVSHTRTERKLGTWEEPYTQPAVLGLRGMGFDP